MDCCKLCGGKADYRAVDKTFKLLAPFLCESCLHEVSKDVVPGGEEFYERIQEQVEDKRKEVMEAK
jgi:hypothetical protein